MSQPTPWQPSSWQPSKGTPIRPCELPFKKCPEEKEITTALDQVGDFQSWKRGDKNKQKGINGRLEAIDKFIHDLEMSRQEGTLKDFKRDNMHPSFASLPEDKFWDVINTIANLRALTINYILSRRVAAVILTEEAIRTFQENGGSHWPARHQHSYRHKRIATQAIEHFWGFQHSGDPLPYSKGAIVISEYDGWHNLIDDKLANVAAVYRMETEKVKKLF